MRGLTPTSDTLSGGLTGGVIDGRYKLIEKLGEGGMGSVYKVEHVRIGKVMALKVLSKGSTVDKLMKDRFLQEARVVAKLSHPNTVQVFDSGELEDGSLYIAMEFVAGRDLAWNLRNHGPMPEKKAAAIGIAVLRSLAEAHANGIIHRDIKPANVMLLRDGSQVTDRVKLLDFGIAKLMEADVKKDITGVTEFIGTPAYISPEQAKGERLDARSDLYSVGALMFELVAGRPVFEGPTALSIVTKHLTERPPNLSDVVVDNPVTPAFEALIDKALKKSPTDRYHSADAMRQALEGISQGAAITTGDFPILSGEFDMSVVTRADFDDYEENLRKGRWRTPLLFVLALVAAGAGALTYLQQQPSRPVTSETEPNDDPKLATRIPLGTDVQATIGATVEGKQDRDMFAIPVEDGLYTFTVSGVEDLNLAAEFFGNEGDSLRRQVLLDDVGVGKGERIDAYAAKKGVLYVRIDERRAFDEAPRSPRERSRSPYHVRAERLVGNPEGYEREPNDAMPQATTLGTERALTAFAGAPTLYPDPTLSARLGAPLSSADYFRFSGAVENGKVAAFVVPPSGGSLFVVDADEYDAWEKRAAGKPSTAPKPKEVTEAELFFGAKSVRVALKSGAEPGAKYYVAFASTGERGLSGVIDLFGLLSEAGKSADAARVVKQAAERFSGSPQWPQLKALLKDGTP